MLSCMETQQGLTIIGPNNTPIHIPRSSPAFVAGQGIVRERLPSEQMLSKLNQLLANPLGPLVDWFERNNMQFRQQGDLIYLKDRALSFKQWLPFLNRCARTMGSPMPALLLAETLGESAKDMAVGSLCLHYDKRLRAVGIVRAVNLPEDTRPGDLVNASSSGEVPYLVAYHDYLADANGGLILNKGKVLYAAPFEAQTQDILAQPVILGCNWTYRCEEGSVEGWLEDRSFDSLHEAVLNAKDIQRTGAEVRIVNRITGDVMAWQ